MFIFCLFTTTIKANENIKFDVKIPSKISINKKYLICKISFKNTSKIPILAPDFLLGGIGISYSYKLYDELNNEIIPSIIYEYHISNKTFNNKPTLLPAGKTRSNIDSLLIESFFPKLGRYRMVFYWDGFLDGNTENELSRFSCEKWIEIRK